MTGGQLPALPFKVVYLLRQGDFRIKIVKELSGLFTGWHHDFQLFRSFICTMGTVAPQASFFNSSCPSSERR